MPFIWRIRCANLFLFGTEWSPGDFVRILPPSWLFFILVTTWKQARLSQKFFSDIVTFHHLILFILATTKQQALSLLEFYWILTPPQIILFFYFSNKETSAIFWILPPSLLILATTWQQAILLLEFFWILAHSITYFLVKQQHGNKRDYH